MDICRPENLYKISHNSNLIRNICLLAHVDHGKTTFADHIIASNGLISNRTAGKLRYMDNKKEEQERGITIKSSCISLVHNVNSMIGVIPTLYLINLIDSPGHIDFSNEVSVAVRLCDSAIILVDVIEGICPQTQTVLRQAWNEGIKILLVFNKMDRLIMEIKITPIEAYEHLRKILGEINSFYSELVASALLQEEEQNAIDLPDEDDEFIEEKVHFSPVKGNVLFASALDGWCFNLSKFASIYSIKLGFNEKSLNKTLWGDYYIHSKEKRIKKGAMTKNKNPLFVTLILDNIWNVYQAILIEKKQENTLKIFKALNLNLPPKDFNYYEPRHLLTSLLMQQWLPISTIFLNAVCLHSPSPLEISNKRLKALFVQSSNNLISHYQHCIKNCSVNNFSSSTKNDNLARDDLKNVENVPTIAFVCKMFKNDTLILPAPYIPNSTNAEECQQEDETNGKSCLEKIKERKLKIQRYKLRFSNPDNAKDINSKIPGDYRPQLLDGHHVVGLIKDKEISEESASESYNKHNKPENQVDIALAVNKSPDLTMRVGKLSDKHVSFFDQNESINASVKTMGLRSDDHIFENKSGNETDIAEFSANDDKNGGKKISIAIKLLEEVDVQARLLALCKVYSGVIKPGASYHVILPHQNYSSHEDDDSEDNFGFNKFDDSIHNNINGNRSIVKVKRVFLCCGGNEDLYDITRLVTINGNIGVTPGNIVALELDYEKYDGALKGIIPKFMTLSSDPNCPPLMGLYYYAQPLLEVAIEPKRIGQFANLHKALRILCNSDPSARYLLATTGQLVLKVMGEVHLEHCLLELSQILSWLNPENPQNKSANDGLNFLNTNNQDLAEFYSQFSVSDPIVPFRETIVGSYKFKLSHNKESISAEHHIATLTKYETILRDLGILLPIFCEEGKEGRSEVNGLVDFAVQALPIPESIMEWISLNRTFLKHLFKIVDNEVIDSNQIDFGEALRNFAEICESLCHCNRAKLTRKLKSRTNYADRVAKINMDMVNVPDLSDLKVIDLDNNNNFNEDETSSVHSTFSKTSSGLNLIAHKANNGKMSFKSTTGTTEAPLKLFETQYQKSPFCWCQVTLPSYDAETCVNDVNEKNMVTKFKNNVKESLVWSMGLDISAPNLLINNLPFYIQSAKMELSNPKKDGSNDTGPILLRNMARKNIDGCVLGAFKQLSQRGPLCEEALSGVCFVLNDIYIRLDAVKRQQSDLHLETYYPYVSLDELALRTSKVTLLSPVHHTTSDFNSDFSAQTEPVETQALRFCLQSIINNTFNNCVSYRINHQEIEIDPKADQQDSNIGSGNGDGKNNNETSGPLFHQSNFIRHDINDRLEGEINPAEKDTDIYSPESSNPWLSKKTSGLLSGQILSETKERFVKTFLHSSPRLALAMYACQVQTKVEALGKMYSVLNKRYGRVLGEECIEGTQLFNVKASLPVIESFGFSQELRTKTSGLANPQLTFSHWELLDEDPLSALVQTNLSDNDHKGSQYKSSHKSAKCSLELEANKEDDETTPVNNRAQNYLYGIRRRKGLTIKEKLVEKAEKQRTLKKNK
ncbi:unnamed protein product [Gordionus sp. m RMFG-2023]